jgi:hypothetical protein
MALTFAYRLKKKYNISKTIYAKFTSDFNSHRLFAKILLSQNFKGKYESRKILDFVRKNDFLKDFFIYFVVSSTF